MPRLQRSTGLDSKMQLLLLSHHSPEGVRVERCPRKGRVTLRDHGVELPNGSVRFFLFDLASMQAKASAAAPEEKLPLFEQEKTGRIFGLLEQSVAEYIERQGNRLDACEVALRFLAQDVIFFLERLAQFEAKWTVLLEQDPLALLDNAAHVVMGLKDAKLRPELAHVARPLWDLYALPAGESLQFIKSTKQDFLSLQKKMPEFLRSCREAIRAAEELGGSVFPPLEAFKTSALELTSMAEHQQLNTQKPADYVLLQRARQEVAHVERRGNNLAHWCRKTLKDVNQRSWTVWSEQSSIGENGVRGLALRKVMANLRTLKVLADLPILQHAIVDEAFQRSLFRERTASTMTHVARQLEPIFLAETNRRTSWLSGQSLYVREWLSEKIPWLEGTVLRYTPVPPAFDQALPTASNALQGTGKPPAVAPFSLFQPLPPPGDNEDDDNGHHHHASDHMKQLESRIEYLEGELRRRLEQLESAQSDFRKRESDLTESNLLLMRQSVPFASGVSQMAATLTAQKQRLSSAFAVRDFIVGDRVCFVRRPAAVGSFERSVIYEVMLCAEVFHVYMSWPSQRHLKHSSELVVARLMDAPRRFQMGSDIDRQEDEACYGLPMGTEYLELVVIDEGFFTYDGKPAAADSDQVSLNNNNNNNNE